MDASVVRSTVERVRRHTETWAKPQLGRWRWVVERTFAWFNQFRRLRLRYEKRPDMHLAFLTLACILICWKFLWR